MPVPCSIPLIGAAIGGSVIAEECRGNYATARQIAETALAGVRQDANPLRLGAALLELGVVRLLQGEAAGAAACFAEIPRAAAEDQVLQLRCAAYTDLAACARFSLLPGHVGLFAQLLGDHVGVAALEINQRWDAVRYLRARQPWVALARSIDDRPARSEADLVLGMLASLPSDRSTFQTARRMQQPIAERQWQLLLGPQRELRQRLHALDADSSLLASIDLAQADLARLARREAPAQALLQQALAAYANAGDDAGQAFCHMRRGDWLAAPNSSPESWNLFLSDPGLTTSERSWEQERIEFARDQIDIAGARAAYAEAERLWSAAHAPRGLAALALRSSYLHMLEGDYARAIEAAAQARAGFEAAGDQLGAWTACAHLALSQLGAGELPEQTAAAIGSWGAAEGSFSYALGLGMFFSRAARRWLVWEGDYERALAAYRLAAALYQALGAGAAELQNALDQGVVYEALGDSRTALTFTMPAIELYEQIVAERVAQGHPDQHRTVALAIACIELTQKAYTLSLRQLDPDDMSTMAKRLQHLLDELLTLSGSSASASPRASLLTSLSRVLSKRSLLTEQASSEWKLWLTAQQVHTILQQAAVLIPLYFARQRRASPGLAAEALYTQALAAAERADADQRDFLVAAVHLEQQHLEQARAAFCRYFTASKAQPGFAGIITHTLSRLWGQAGQLEARAHEISAHSTALSFLVRCNAFDDAQAHLQALGQLAGPSWWARERYPWNALRCIGELYEGQGDLDQALETYDFAIDQFEARRAQLTRDELRTTVANDAGPQLLYFLAARAALRQHALAVEQGDHERRMSCAQAMFLYAERGRARALLDQIAGSATHATLPQAERQELFAWRQAMTRQAVWRGLLAREQARTAPDQARVAELIARVDQEDALIDQLEAGLARTSPHLFRAVNPQATLLSLAEVSALLPPGTLLLQYVFLRGDLIGWAMTHEGMVRAHHATIDSQQLSDQILAFHHACERQASIVDAGAQLAGILLAPFADIIDSSAHVLIVPYGASHQLPFHALPWHGQPLAMSHTVSYLPNASMLQFARHTSVERPPRLLAVGSPARMSYLTQVGSSRQAAPDLPAAAVEAAYVASMFEGSVLLLHERATEAAVIEHLGHCSLLHLATHGYLSSEAPLLSSLLLADGAELSVYELLGLHLDVDLVVLSACRTAQGEMTSGDEVLGLARGLLAAGARAAIVSLWPVDDLATSLLMKQFYERLHAGDTPAQALRQAQAYLCTLDPEQIKSEIEQMRAALQHLGEAALEQQTPIAEARDTRRPGAPNRRRDYHHPFYWAPFLLIGH